MLKYRRSLIVQRWSKTSQACIGTLLFPPRCLLCDAKGAGDLDLCRECAAQLPWLEPEVFWLDGRLPVIAALRYRDGAAELIRRLKYTRTLAVAPLLAMLLHTAMRRQSPISAPDLVLPVPLHWRRLRWRGFNQAVEIARPLCRQLRLPYSTRLAQRVRWQHNQSQLDRQQRRQLNAQSFALYAAPPPHVALLDDVCTTGATALALAERLRQHGCQHIQLWSVAHTL